MYYGGNFMKKKLLLVALCISLVLSMAAFAQASGSDKKSDNAGKQEVKPSKLKSQMRKLLIGVSSPKVILLPRKRH